MNNSYPKKHRYKNLHAAYGVLLQKKYGDREVIHAYFYHVGM